MKKICKTKELYRMLSLFVTVCLMVGLFPITTYAGTAPPYVAHGDAVSSYADYDLDNQDVWVYMTDNAGYIEKTGDGTSLCFTACDFDDGNYVFSHWETYYYGTITKDKNYSWSGGSKWCFSKPGYMDQEYDRTERTIQVNNEFVATGVYFVVAVYDVKVSRMVINGEGDYDLECDYDAVQTVHKSGCSSDGVVYACVNSTMSVRAFYNNSTQVVDSVTVNGVATADYYYVNDALKKWLRVDIRPVRPTTVVITFRNKIQKVSFGANGGEGVMATQAFESGVAEVLDVNGFTRTGYIFNGWNTSEDNTGTAYSDGQEVAFAPENDGDIITLYAQWTECNNHNWSDGSCIECGLDCNHRYTYSAADDVVTETCVENCGHQETATIEQDEMVATSYNGAPIEPLKVVYSDGWQGGTLEIAYSNHINAGIAMGTIVKGNARATKTFVITPISMDGVTAVGYNGDYDGRPHGITVGGVPTGATVTYSAERNGTYSGERLTYTDAGDYTIWYQIKKANHTTVTGSAEVHINKVNLTVTAKDSTIIYGDAPIADGVAYVGFVNGEDSSVLDGTLGYDSTYVRYDDIGDHYMITPKGLVSDNYNITYVAGALVVKKKVLDIDWGNTDFFYIEGKEQVPEPKAVGAVSDDEIAFVVEGAKEKPGTYTATVTDITSEKADNYQLPDEITTTFVIKNGLQETPLVNGRDETISAKADGIIIGVDSSMEYRKVEEQEYTAIDGNTIEGLAAGSYYVRYKAKAYYDPSPDTEVVIGEGRKLIVSLPAEQVGYKLNVSATELDWNDSVTISFDLERGYVQSAAFALKVNGQKVDLSDKGDVILSGVNSDLVVAVEGVVMKDGPVTGNYDVFYAMMLMLGSLSLFGILFVSKKNI